MTSSVERWGAFVDHLVEAIQSSQEAGGLRVTRTKNALCQSSPKDTREPQQASNIMELPSGSWVMACSHLPQVFGVLHEACRPGVLAKVGRKDIHGEVHEGICHVNPLSLSSGEPWEAPRAVLKAERLRTITICPPGA